jgi:hypothetical protein
MKSIYYLLLSILLLSSVPAFAQIGIGTESPAPSAVLDVSAINNNKGILIPRISATQKDAIVSPAQGLLIYQTTAPIGFYYYMGTTWNLIAIQTDIANKVDKVDGKVLTTNDYTTLEKAKLAAITGTNTGDQTNISGNAATATKLAASKNINGVAFDGSADINIAATASAEQLTGTTLKSTVTGSSLTSVGTLTGLTVTAPIVGSITGNAATAGTVTTNANLSGVVTSIGNTTSIANGAISNSMLANGAVMNLSGTNTGDQTTISGNAGTATKLAASKNINGVAFDGSGDITVPADAGTLSGTTLNDLVLLFLIINPMNVSPGFPFRSDNQSL